jgi:hypothetical protein
MIGPAFNAKKVPASRTTAAPLSAHAMHKKNKKMPAAAPME